MKTNKNDLNKAHHNFKSSNKINQDLKLKSNVKKNKSPPPKINITLHNDHVNYQEGKNNNI